MKKLDIKKSIDNEFFEVNNQYYSAIERGYYDEALRLNQKLYNLMFDRSLGNIEENPVYDKVSKLFSKTMLLRIQKEAESIENLKKLAEANQNLEKYLRFLGSQ